MRKHHEHPGARLEGAIQCLAVVKLDPLEDFFLGELVENQVEQLVASDAHEVTQADLPHPPLR